MSGHAATPEVKLDATSPKSRSPYASEVETGGSLGWLVVLIALGALVAKVATGVPNESSPTMAATTSALDPTSAPREASRYLGHVHA